MTWSATSLLIVLTFVLGSCSSTEPWVEPDDYRITLDGRLSQDADGFYHLRLLRDRFQTVHRLTGEIIDSKGQPPYQPLKIAWESSHVWYYTPGDTVITIYRRNVNAQGRWVVIDTATVLAPDSLVVPTVNPASYSDASGEIYTMIGPVLPMFGDTMTISAAWTSTWYTTDTVRALVRIILE